jgi:hypothetical protein
VVDLDTTRRTNEFSDLSAVEKYEMPEEAYAQRPGACVPSVPAARAG